MNILFCSDSDPPQPWREALTRAFPGLGFRVWPDLGPPEDIRYALAWRPPAGMLATLPNLKAILVLGAGVDAALDDPTVPPSIPVVRLLGAGMEAPMAEYAHYAVMHFQRHMHDYPGQQREIVWRRIPWKLAEEWPVGVMGLGVIGGFVARRLAACGYPVAGWSRTPRQVDGLETFAGRTQLSAFLARSRVVVNVLPLTSETANILDAAAFAAMPRGSYVVNIGRGAHLVEEDLIAALDSGQLGGAMLDVFREEPLPPAHPFWRHPGIFVTPHAAAPTIIAAAQPQVIENIRRLERGEPPLGLVDRARGY
jgi:glyoxylate/hydroxypyruvate reductase A